MLHLTLELTQPRCIQFLRRTAVQTAVSFISSGVLVALLAGIAMKPRRFGPN